LEDANEQTSLPGSDQTETAPQQGSEGVKDTLEEVVTDSPVSGETESNEHTGGDEQSTDQPVPQDQVQQPKPIQEQPQLPVEPIPEAPEGFEAIPVQFSTYESNSFLLTVKYEVTMGDILISTLLAFIVVVMLVRFFHSLIFGRG
jgi:hypothetical protein